MASKSLKKFRQQKNVKSTLRSFRVNPADERVFTKLC